MIFMIFYILWKASNSYPGGYTQESTPIGHSIYYHNVAGWVAIQHKYYLWNQIEGNVREIQSPTNLKDILVEIRDRGVGKLEVL